MNFKDYKVQEFIEDLSSDSSSPGGGSVAALVAALAGSLNSMVYSLTVNKKSFEEQEPEVKKLVLDFKEASGKFIKKSMELMELDRKYFNELMDSFKLKKDTEEEKKIRSMEIFRCTIKAMKSPLDLAKECYKFYDNIDIAVKYGNKMLSSDAGCAAVLLHAAIETSIINVKVNLNSLKNKDFAQDVENEIKELEKNSIEKKNNILNVVNKIIYPENN